jgi:hypothetical protein
VNEINSGVSTIYRMSNLRTICVYREEEMLKVLCHELIHAYELDSKRSQNQELVNIFDIKENHQLNPNEAYVEFMAVCYNSLFTLIENNIYSKKLFNFIINQEIKHNIKQVAKILNYYGYTDINEFINPVVKKYKYRENTSIISYFIIKLFILINYKNNLMKSYDEIFDNINDLFSNQYLKKQINLELSKKNFTDDSLKMTFYKKIEI